MSEENIEKSALVPRLRFPEFRDGWRLFTVSDFFDLTDKSEKTTTFNKDKVLTVKLRANGVVKNEKTTLTGGANYFNRRSGQFVFSKIDLLNGAFGVVPDNLDGFASSSDVPAYSFNAEHSSTFFVNWLKANYENLDIERTGTSTTLKRVSPEKFLALAVSAPNFPEQQKIADCLSSLDELIAAETQKLDALKTHKKGLMQQLFPREGETVPRLRFPEFREEGEWDEKRLGEVGSVRMCKRILKEQTSPSGDIPFYKIGTFGGVPDAYIPRDVFESFRAIYPFPKNGAVLISAAGTIGRTVRYDGELAYFQDSNIVWLENDEALIADNFLLYIYQLINWAPSVGAIQRLYNENILGTQVKFPRSIPEQQQIAACLSSIDDLITAQGQKIDALKTHKQGLMQQLFPVLNEVPA